ncbi:glucose-6-phosphate isomerase [Bacillus sp. FJAT-49711]|uniref:glucose-6-phosphate isomerase family protein n=1 Tax=Bacillus sp. FJAT-49711 TaxID=2833585 RepID=UPI001BC94417|nr:glucose-6-phosphate isomerase family protein [Bacillus sp. FJAT-49711]MBS4219000.1 glucose-6-phosphate isomerase [Bacillus sp. FJAT-49711]
MKGREILGNFATFLSSNAYLDLGAKKHVRRLSQLKDIYTDKDVIGTILKREDPVIYEVYEMPQPFTETDLLVNITVLHPGKVGEELYMTKGHFHEEPDTAEVVIGLQGSGVLLLQNREGVLEEKPVMKDWISYSAGGWAHRVVNMGTEDLVFLAISGANIIHDYETAARLNFK